MTSRMLATIINWQPLCSLLGQMSSSHDTHPSRGSGGTLERIMLSVDVSCCRTGSPTKVDSFRVRRNRPLVSRLEMPTHSKTVDGVDRNGTRLTQAQSDAI